jgi:hypothetical protein
MTKEELLLLTDCSEPYADMILPLFVLEVESDSMLVEVIKTRLGDVVPLFFDTHIGLNNDK